MPDEALPIVQPAEAIAWFRAKGYVISFDWRDIWQEEHTKAFTVAKAMSRDLLEDIREAVDKALDEGLTLEQFSAELRPRLVRRGWWGRRRLIDPETGEDKVVRLGSPARLRTIYQTNLRTSYMAGRWQRIQRSKRAFPFLRYVSVMDGRERPEHGAWHDTILPVDDPWWDTHFPPCGWNCRCDAQPLNQRLLDRRGQQLTEDPPRFPERDYVNKRTGEVTKVERGIDPGWSYNVGKASLDGLAPPPRVRSSPDDGIGTELNATVSSDAYERLKGFFAPFGMETRDAAIAGMVHRDQAGWPLVISTGLFRSAGGTMVDLAPGVARGLGAAAQTLIDPDRIGWLWVTGRDGRKMLVRRYIGELGVVDIGGRFWRWMDGSAGAFARGRLVWTRDEGVIANYDPRQPRGADGKWSRTGSGLDGFYSAALGKGDGPASHSLGTVSDHGDAQLKRLGLSGRNRKGERKEVALDLSLTRHSLRRHGSDGRGQIGLDAQDLRNMRGLFNSGTFNHGNPRKANNGSPVVYVTGTVKRRRYSATFEVRKNTVVPGSIRRKK